MLNQASNPYEDSHLLCQLCKAYFRFLLLKRFCRIWINLGLEQLSKAALIKGKTKIVIFCLFIFFMMSEWILRGNVSVQFPV